MSILEIVIALISLRTWPFFKLTLNILKVQT